MALVACALLSITLDDDWLYRLIAFLVLTVAVVTIWSNSRWQWWGRIWHRDKVRFLVGIYCDDVTVEPQIEEDFTREIRTLIKDGNLGKDVVLVTATRAECKLAESQKEVADLLVRKRAHMLIYGRVRRRPEGTSEAFYIGLQVAVRHAAIEKQLQRNFSHEMTTVFPSGIWSIPVMEALPKLKVHAEWVAVSTRYILSLAAGLSGDLDYAEKMLSDAIALAPRLNSDISRRTKINDRLRLRLNGLYRAQANRAYFRWRKNRARAEAENLKKYLLKALPFSPTNAPLKQLLAVANFILSGNAEQAEKDLRAALFDDPSAYASIAFVCAMQGKYALARRAYRDMWKRQPSADIVDQVITFCRWCRDEYPAYSVPTRWCELIVSRHVNGVTADYKIQLSSFLHSSVVDSDERSLLEQDLI